MKEYYFVASLLPPLEIGHIPSLGFFELMDILAINLDEEDLEKIRKFRMLIDIENMRAFWADEPLDPRGNIKKDDMEQVLHDQMWPKGEEFPFYLKDYLNHYHTKEDRLHHFASLLNQFYLIESENEGNFLKEYFAFQREMRLILLGFRAKKLRRDIVAELQYEDPTDPIVAHLLAQKDAKSFEPPFDYKDLKPIFEEFGNSPFALNKALYEYQFNTIVEIWGSDLFTIDRILNYLSRLLLVEKWQEMDIREGMTVIGKIEKEIQ